MSLIAEVHLELIPQGLEVAVIPSGIYRTDAGGAVEEGDLIPGNNTVSLTVSGNGGIVICLNSLAYLHFIREIALRAFNFFKVNMTAEEVAAAPGDQKITFAGSGYVDTGVGKMISGIHKS